MPSATASLLRLFLPDFILENFEFKEGIEDSETFHIELEELNNPPSEWDGMKVLSKGFFPQIVIQDFPIRGHKAFFHVRRRRCPNTEISKVICRNCFSRKGNANGMRFRCFFKRNQSMQRRVV